MAEYRQTTQEVIKGGSGTVILSLNLVSKIRSSAVLPHHDKIHPLDDLRLEGREFASHRDTGRVGRARPQVGIDIHRLAQLQQASLGSIQPATGMIPLRASHGREQHCVRVQGRLLDLLRDGGAVLVDTAASDQLCLQLEWPCGGLEGREDFHGLGHDFRPDAVAGQDEDLGHFWVAFWQGST